MECAAREYPLRKRSYTERGKIVFVVAQYCPREYYCFRVWFLRVCQCQDKLSMKMSHQHWQCSLEHQNNRRQLEETRVLVYNGQRCYGRSSSSKTVAEATQPPLYAYSTTVKKQEIEDGTPRIGCCGMIFNDCSSLGNLTTCNDDWVFDESAILPRDFGESHFNSTLPIRTSLVTT